MATNGGELAMRHPMQAQAILVVAAVVLVVEVLNAVLTRLLIELRPTAEEDELRQRAAAIKREAKDYNLPATFIKWAKMEREAGALEKDLLKMQEERRVKAAAPWRRQLSRALGLRRYVLFVALYFGYEATLPQEPLMEVSSDWMWPYSRLLALPNHSAGALSVVAWSVVSQKVFARVLAQQ